MFTVWVIFHVLVCIALVIVVLMQSSKGEGLAGSAFGGGGVSGAVFGGRGAASFLSKATTVLAIVFMINCGGLAFLSAGARSGADFSNVTESTVTREAQQELQRQQAAQQQQQQQQQQADTGGVSLDELMNQSATDTSGGGGQ
ncbi:MAG: preprotein translocase subunit SecG [Anaerolineales bacterium]